MAALGGGWCAHGAGVCANGEVAEPATSLASAKKSATNGLQGWLTREKARPTPLLNPLLAAAAGLVFLVGGQRGVLAMQVFWANGDVLKSQRPL